LTRADEEGTHKTLSVYLDAITVLTRMLASVTVVDMSNMRILVIVSAILLLCIAVLVLWYSEEKYGVKESDSWLT